MDFQTLINVGAGTCLGVAGWFARQLWSAVQDLRNDLSKLREELPRTYITKDDFKDASMGLKADLKDAVSELKAMLIAINVKLDKKSDKP